MWQDKAANQIIIGDWESETHALFVESEKIDPSSHKQPRQYGLNRGKNKQVRLFLSSADTFNAFRISDVFVGHMERNFRNIRLQIKSSRDIGSRKLTHCLSSRRRLAHPATKSDVSTLKSNNKAMLCYEDAESSQELKRWRS